MTLNKPFKSFLIALLIFGLNVGLLPHKQALAIVSPSINALSFAGRTGTVTGGNTVDLNLTGVSDADLASAGSINVSATSTLNITFPVALPSGPIPPVNLNTGT
ncbi:hypothetical protein HGA64_01700, partial [Candidatus Falkowbacteria bacterium]|nr:hypothetical protein [Candidatus Falkowbacteria bacterium]